MVTIKGIYVQTDILTYTVSDVNLSTHLVAGSLLCQMSRVLPKNMNVFFPSKKF